MCRQRCVMVLVVAATWMAAVSARAGYNWGGDGMKEIASGTISNGAVYMQSYGAGGLRTPTLPADIRPSLRLPPATMSSMRDWCLEFMVAQPIT